MISIGRYVAMQRTYRSQRTYNSMNEINVVRMEQGENEFNAGRAAMHRVSTEMTGEMEIVTNKFGLQSKNLASIIRGYKSAVTTYARKNNLQFAWQPLFHDHIIRDAIESKKIQKYIANNPKNWKDDSLYE